MASTQPGATAPSRGAERPGSGATDGKPEGGIAPVIRNGQRSRQTQLSRVGSPRNAWRSVWRVGRTRSVLPHAGRSERGSEPDRWSSSSGERLLIPGAPARRPADCRAERRPARRAGRRGARRTPTERCDRRRGAAGRRAGHPERPEVETDANDRGYVAPERSAFRLTEPSVAGGRTARQAFTPAGSRDQGSSGRPASRVRTGSQGQAKDASSLLRRRRALAGRPLRRADPVAGNDLAQPPLLDGLDDDFDVRELEVVALEQERFVEVPREGVRKAVPHV